MPNWHLPAKSQQWNHQNKDENLFKVSNKDTRTVSMKRRSCVFIANFQQIWHISHVSIADLEQVNDGFVTQ